MQAQSQLAGMLYPYHALLLRGISHTADLQAIVEGVLLSPPDWCSVPTQREGTCSSGRQRQCHDTSASRHWMSDIFNGMVATTPPL
jgi:hypothetical protein